MKKRKFSSESEQDRREKDKKRGKHNEEISEIRKY